MSRIRSPPALSSTSGSRTILAEQPQVDIPVGTLHLEPPSRAARPQVRWEDDVVDNEHLNKKKSKVCCIFHPQREFGESSDESSSSSSSDESESDFGGFSDGERAEHLRRRQQAPKKMKKKREASHKHSHDHDHDHENGECGHSHDHESGSSDEDEGDANEPGSSRRPPRSRQERVQRQTRSASPNAYERQPKYKPKAAVQ